MSDKEEHPSFGVIRVTRVQGGDRRLFGSKVTHHHFMTVELLTASRERHLSQEWIYPRQIVASVAMSEAQWATFVSSPNVGGESGPGARSFNPDWARSIRDQCRAAGVPFFMKQIDKRQPIPADLMIREFPDAE